MVDFNLKIGNKFITAGVEVYVHQKVGDDLSYLGKATKAIPYDGTIQAEPPLVLSLGPVFLNPPYYLDQPPYHDELNIVSRQTGCDVSKQQLNNTDWQLTISMAPQGEPRSESDTTNVTVGEPQ